MNTLVIVLAQLPIANVLEGRRRMQALAVMAALWAGAWLVVLASGACLEAAAAVAVFAVAGVLFGLGECFQGPTQGALTADLAPPHLRGRYMAVGSMSWEIGFVLAPAVGGSSSLPRRLPSGRSRLWPASSRARARSRSSGASRASFA